MKKFVLLGLGLCWATMVGAAELNVDFTFSASDVSLIPAGDYTVIGLADGTRPVDEVGAPAIPAKYANILLPAGAQNVKISASGDWTLLAQGITPYPSQPRSPKSKSRPAFVSANSRYASATAWPAEMAAYQGDQDMQGYRFVSVRVNPLAYVGAEKKLYLREKVTVTVSYDVAAAARTISSKQKSEFEPLVNSLVVNPTASSTFAPKVRTSEPKSGAVDYLIITSSALSNAFQQIANYRASATGGSYTTRVLTTNDIASAYTGTDMQAKIRACISNAVATLGTTMVVLGGDDTIVPVRYCYATVPDQSTTETNMPTDLYYSGLSGNWNADGDSIYGETTDNPDMAWDVIVARIPVRTAAQATNYLNKVMSYESRSPVTNKIILGGPNAWDTYTGTTRPSDDVTGDGHAGFRATTPLAHTSVSDSEAWLRRLYRDGIHPYWPASVNIICDTITSWDSSTCGDYSQSEANTKTAFNKNYTHLMFSGHGEPRGWGLETGDEFLYSDASSMTGMVAFVYTDACLTGHFDKSSDNIDGSTWTTEPCLAESFLRNANTLGGAVAYMGCARYGWGEPDSTGSNTSDGGPSTIYAYKFYKRMYETPGRTLGLAFAMHKADMVSVSGTNGCDRWIQFGMNLLGDPALKMPAGAASLSAPVFGANPGPVSATAGVAVACTVSASGNPAPTLALKTTTASSGYSFTAGTGLLSYTPPGADVGSRTFTITASNSQGVATQVVSVTVASAPLAPPAAPASIWASATNSTDFTAAWSAVTDATGYRLDVATNSSFSGGGGGGGGTATNCYHSGTLGAGTGGNWTETGLTQGSGYLVSLTGDVLITPVMDFTATTAETLAFKARTYGGANTAANTITISVSTDNGSNWTSLGTRVPLTATLTAMTSFDLSLYNNSQVRVKFETLGATGSIGAGIDDVLITSTASAASASYISGYSNRTVASTSQSVTGLTSGVTYYFRARAVSAGGTGTYSTVASVATSAGASAPVFGANPGPVSTTTGVAVAFTVSASGSPAPTLALKSTTASSGYSFTAGTGALSYTPPVADGGVTRTFTFTASNSAGVVTQIVSVVVNNAPATAPSFTSGTGPYVTTTGVAVAFTVSASGSPAPTLALKNTTASSGYSFTPGTGVLNYTPPVADVGSRTFTFTASNSAGMATQIVSVTVGSAMVGGGLENFNNYTNTSGTYQSGTFAGQDGSTWTFALARGDLGLNGGQSPTIKNAVSAYIKSGTIPGGVGTLQLKFRRPYTTTLNCSVYVNGTLAGTITGGDYTTQTWASATLNIAGDVVMVFSNKSTSGQITLDDISWTGYAGGGLSGAVPAVNAIGMQSLMVGKILNTTVTATEADGDAVTFACSSAVNGSRWTLDANSGAFSFAPAVENAGTAEFDFTATDKDGTSSAVPMSVVVSPPPAMATFDPPVSGTLASATIATEAGRTYVLQYTTSLTNNPPVWEEADSADGTGDALTLQDSTVGSQRFYRIVIP